MDLFISFSIESSYFRNMIDFPNAKINLGLYVTSKRTDGYHNILSVFAPVDLADVLEFIPSEQVSFKSQGIAIPGNPMNNLILKAYQLLKDEHSLPAISIQLDKIIPLGAGLGGGSADGSFMLTMLNQYFKLGLSIESLKTLALKLGSDCPFFIENTPKLVSETGQLMEQIDIDLIGYEVALINPGIHISTTQAYGGVIPKKTKIDLKSVLRLNPVAWESNGLRNDFEESVFQLAPEIKAAKDFLVTQGALYASMTGSGSTVYGIFDKRVDLPIHNKKWKVYWTKIKG